ncbi:cupin domain-containing protein [Leucobacter sp. UT-8R-CII-1-4]|uniref:cupin domain-containing protein n=1 Tax=Leucobacter sp. UT-8R-CII-1-4 TaxID=3040075 RepID=UPI0024A9F81A|nr:cupin domain-containing protein [Leucobacter sp. UT-8R-CII-1-4]MDI6022188.1 cupin domain-containing protein [Leucobacter sp. UT-8R-CII-1-4]
MPTVSKPSYVIGASADQEFVPFEHPKPHGEPGMAGFGEIAVLRDKASNGNVLVAAFWRSQPAVSPLYDAPLGDEAGYVTKGSATVELLDLGETQHLAAGDLYFFEKGTLMRWTIHEPFEKFVVVADS